MPKRPSIPNQVLNHPWRVSLKRAAIIQTELAPYLSLVPLTVRPRYVAGIDAAQRDNIVYVAVVLMDLKEERVMEIQCAQSKRPITFPYISGYRAFREGAVIMEAFRRLHYQPQLIFVPGHGVCHPRQCGMASHIGLRLDLPVIGCAKERLVGHFDPPGPKKGDYTAVRYSPQTPAVVLRTRENVNPVYVSPGHRIDLIGAIEQTLRCCTKYRIPEPLRRAHIEAGRYMRRKMAGQI